jgi:hypothetical protein
MPTPTRVSWSLDYELGEAEREPPGYWAAIERGKDPETLKHRAVSPLWEVIAREFRGR